ncbi:hypothetical protein V6N13_021274 [Hibiscus sabdariffa]|uniref:Rieske domain-containing protein n=1 Tax=Hibiscus sabdariffa TaxID=183260 RepID=A0ABR2EW08_9ROSI
MAVSFPGFPSRFWGGGSKEKQSVAKGSSLKSSSETFESKTKITPAKGKGKWQGIDREFDIVVVPSDGGYESDGPEWSIGWEEPHGASFRDEEDDGGGGGGFVVLVPCYKHGCKELVYGPNDKFLNAIKTFPNGSLMKEATLCSSHHHFLLLPEGVVSRKYCGRSKRVNIDENRRDNGDD